MAATIPSTAPNFALFSVAEMPVFPARRSHAGSWTVGLPEKYRLREEPTEELAPHCAAPEPQGSTGASLRAQAGTIRALGKLKNSIDRRPSGIKDQISRSSNAKEINAEYVKLYASKDLEEPSVEVKRKYFGSGAQQRFFSTYRQLSSRGSVLLGGYDELAELVQQPAEENAMMWSVQQLEASGVLTPRNDSSGGREAAGQDVAARVSGRAKDAAAVPQQRHRRAAADAMGAAVAVAELYSDGALPQDVSADLQQRIFGAADAEYDAAEAGFSTASGEQMGSFDSHELPTTAYNVTRLPPIVLPGGARGASPARKTDSSEQKQQQQQRAGAGAGAGVAHGSTVLLRGGEESMAFDELTHDSSHGRRAKGASFSRGSSMDADADADSDGDRMGAANGEDSDSSVDLDKQVADLSLRDSYAVASPRAIFLAGCLREDIPPMTQALIRRKLSSSINLAHMGIGNKVAAVLATCLPAIPYLQLLNLMDNNLDDEGLSVLIRSVARHKDLEILDISQNIIGSEAAGALAEYIGNPHCRLQCLRMSSANIDDGECANFVDVLMHNQQLKVPAALVSFSLSFFYYRLSYYYIDNTAALVQ